jgi:hypothetical protein
VYEGLKLQVRDNITAVGRSKGAGMSWQLSKDVERAFDPTVAIQERRKEAEVLTLLALLVHTCERSARRWRSKSAARRQRYSLYLLYWYTRASVRPGGGDPRAPQGGRDYSLYLPCWHKSRGTQFTCFTGPKGQALTQVEEEQGSLAETRRLYL